MDFQTAVRTCLNKYVGFSGRARRSEYWYFALFAFLVSCGAGILDAAIFQGEKSAFGSLASLAFFLPTLAASVRRLHDTDRSGWWYLIVLVPIVGFILLIVWFSNRGTVGTNRFGPDPVQQIELGGDPASL